MSYLTRDNSGFTRPVEAGTFADIPALAADRIITRGWVRGAWTGPDGEECLHQAVRMCAPVEGDGYVVSAWLAANGWPPTWNDAPGVDRDQVLAMLKGLNLTDEAIEATFGPGCWEWVQIVRQAATLTPTQVTALARGARVDMDAVSAAVRAAWNAAAYAASVDSAEYAAYFASAASAAYFASADFTDAGHAVYVAAWAAITRHLIGTADYTQKHYDILIGPWQSVFGEDELGDNEGGFV